MALVQWKLHLKCPKYRREIYTVPVGVLYNLHFFKETDMAFHVYSRNLLEGECVH
jgi:hypothetical protein